MHKKIELPENIREIAKIAKALSHPVRAYIVMKLANKTECCYSGDLVEELPIARSTLSQHLKELKYSGLIQGEINPPYIKLCINRKNFELAAKHFNELFHNENKYIKIGEL